MGTRRRRTKEMAITAFLTGHGRRASSSSSPYAARIRRAWRCGTRASSAGVGFRGTDTSSRRQQARTFIVHTQCKSDEIRTKYSDFWLDGQKEMYIVRHNYGSQRFFEKADAIKMELVILPGDERGYRVTTDKVNFEFGFAYKNLLTNEWLYEIGAKNKAPLSLGNCVQRYGKFFNRVMTIEDPDADIEYVWGS